MRNRVLKQIGGLATAVVLAGVGLLGTVTGASAAPATMFDLNGPWTDGGGARPVISEMNGTIVVDMSYANRPSANGYVKDASTIILTFPDDRSYIGKLSGSNVISWNNNTSWYKVYTGDLAVTLNNTTWAPGGATSYLSNGFIQMSLPGRPLAQGYALSGTEIVVTFPDDATYHGLLQPGGLNRPDAISWSNNTSWQATGH